MPDETAAAVEQNPDLFGLRFFREQRIAENEVLAKQMRAAQPSISFFALLLLSAVIATNGLIADSAATVIGAMIVAPLMQPISAMAYGMATANRRLLFQAFITTAAGAACAVAVAALTAIALGVHAVGHEIVGRTAPTLLDLAVAIAAGTCGGLAATRRNIADAMPGVAIAVALVPPLCVAGIGLGLGRSAVPEVGLALPKGIVPGASLLFLANLAGIVFSTMLVFVLQRYGGRSTAPRGMAASVLVLLVLAFPLAYAFDDLITRQNVRRYLAAVREARPEIHQQILMRRLSVNVTSSLVTVDVEIIVPRNLEVDLIGEAERVRQYLAQMIGRDVEVKTTILRADIMVTKAAASG